MLIDRSMLIGACRLLRQIGDGRRHGRADRWAAHQLRLQLMIGRRRRPDAAPVWVPHRRVRGLLRLLDRCTTDTGSHDRQRHALIALLGVMLLDSLPTHIPRPDPVRRSPYRWL